MILNFCVFIHTNFFTNSLNDTMKGKITIYISLAKKEKKLKLRRVSHAGQAQL